MKTVFKIIICISVCSIIVACGAKGNASAGFKVWGNCDMCKETIEGALKTDGVTSADWNKDTKMMTVSFDSTKINLDQIEKKIAATGYDTELYTGDDKAYQGLPECCQYDRK